MIGSLLGGYVRLGDVPENEHTLVSVGQERTMVELEDVVATARSTSDVGDLSRVSFFMTDRVMGRAFFVR